MRRLPVIFKRETAMNPATLLGYTPTRGDGLAGWYVTEQNQFASVFIVGAWQ